MPRRFSARLLSASLCLVTGSGFAQAQDRPVNRKLNTAEQSDARDLVILADTAIKGLPASGGLRLTFQSHFLKAAGGKTYVPFTVAIAGADQASRAVGLYVRVAVRGDTKTSAQRSAGTRFTPDYGVPMLAGERWLGTDESTPSQASAALRSAERQRDTDPYPFEDVHFVEWTSVAGPEVRRIDRALMVAPGSYDLYLAVRERGRAPAPGAPGASGMLKVPLDVPDFSTARLAFSDIIVSERVQPLNRLLSTGEQVTRPYAFGSFEIVPVLGRSFARNAVLTLVFFVYNAGEQEGKPDLRLEYLFVQEEGDTKQKRATHFQPQVFAADTLPPDFDLRKGQSLTPTLELALRSFDPGRYRLEINAVDNMGMATATRSFHFTVTAP